MCSKKIKFLCFQSLYGIACFCVQVVELEHESLYKFMCLRRATVGVGMRQNFLLCFGVNFAEKNIHLMSVGLTQCWPAEDDHIQN